ncbi:MAG TPA: hypothetical protein PKM57_15185 [Kiritimatiellia bacterium]|nr:hypothetical protein [Kiritimatiellia bacterium]HPS08171.1 hypothetical protein [Kiritimatiellia bacterium]
MATIPLSDVTLIATGLGIFFLIVAFYKSIFHKRRPPSHNLPTTALPAPVPSDSQPIKLADPFQQVPVDSLPLGRKPQAGASSFYPAFPHPASPPVSAFRQFNPNKDFDAAASQKNEAAYEWE